MLQKITCNLCEQRCRKKQKYQQCCKCRKFTHQKCTNISPRQFSYKTDPQGQNPFVCELCTVQSPTSISSYHASTAATQNNTSQESNSYTYQNISSLNSELKSEGDILVLHINIVSLVANFDEVKSLISQTKFMPDFICISETRLLRTKKLNGNPSLSIYPITNFITIIPKQTQGVLQFMSMKTLRISKLNQN